MSKKSKTLLTALHELKEAEGHVNALKIAEDWNDMLESMSEVSTDRKELKAIVLLTDAVQNFIRDVVREQAELRIWPTK